MKKWLLVVAAVMMLASCSGGNTTEVNNEETNTQVNAENEKIGDRGYNEQNFETDERIETKPILPEEEADFGNFKWGMALDDVVNVHGAGYSNLDNNTIRYERVRIEGFASDAEYVFTDGKLSKATYFIMPDDEYEDKTQYISDYNSLAEIYTKRFGKPSKEEIQFAEGKDTDDIKEQGELLGKGMILFRKVWTTDTTEIRAVMAKKGDICIGVQITPINK